MEARRFL